MSILNGYKTYIVAILIALAAALRAVQPLFPGVAWLQAINTGWVDVIVNFLLAGGGAAVGLMTLRHAVAKTEHPKARW
jgi:hypothetical protein